MSIQGIENIQEESLEDEDLEKVMPKGKSKAEEFKNNGDWTYWADIVAKMKTLNPGIGISIEPDALPAIKETLDRKKKEAEKGKEWLYFASLASDLKRINPEMDIVDDKAKEKILEQIKETGDKKNWHDYVRLLSMMKIIDKNASPVPSDEMKAAIIADAGNRVRTYGSGRGSFDDINYAANVRMVFTEMSPGDLSSEMGVDAGVLNRAQNDLEHPVAELAASDYFSKKADLRILTTEKLNIP
jgi:hypothetical protein